MHLLPFERFAADKGRQHAADFGIHFLQLLTNRGTRILVLVCTKGERLLNCFKAISDGSRLQDSLLGLNYTTTDEDMGSGAGIGLPEKLSNRSTQIVWDY